MTRNLVKQLLGLLAISYLVSGISSAQEVAQSFTAPRAVDPRSPQYPLAEAGVGAEGWVTLNFMVNTEGEVFEPTVVGSSGPKAFQQAALRALERSAFEPASLDGEPVEGSAYMTYRFVMNGNRQQVRGSFKRSYEDLLELVENGERQESTELLNEMIEETTHNNMEYALLNMARLIYSDKFGGDELEQMEYLQNALLFESYSGKEDRGYLPDDLVNIARQRLFMLQVNNSRYAEAIRTYEFLKDEGVDTGRFEATIEQLQQLQQDDSMYVVKGKTDANGYWRAMLFKPGLHIDNLGSRLSEFRLRCRNKYQFFAFQEGAQYQIPESWGLCSLEILGEADAEFEVVQFR